MWLCHYRTLHGDPHALTTKRSLKAEYLSDSAHNFYFKPFTASFALLPVIDRKGIEALRIIVYKRLQTFQFIIGIPPSSFVDLVCSYYRSSRVIIANEGAWPLSCSCSRSPASPVQGRALEGLDSQVMSPRSLLGLEIFLSNYRVREHVNPE